MSPGILLSMTLTVAGIRNQVIQGDCLVELAKLPDECVDLIFIDPPYFLQLPGKKLLRWNVRSEVDGVDDEWDKFDSFEDYDRFIRGLLIECRRVMKSTASIWVIGTYHNIFRLGALMQDMGFWILNDVHWVKTNPMPNWLGVRFTNATETLIWAVREQGAKGHAFDKQAAREFGMGKIGDNVWVLPICGGSQRLKGPDGLKLHSTQKPVELLRRVILCSSRPGDLVLDPVAGTGTTGFVAASLGRDYLMIEANAKYVAGIRERLSS